MARKDVGHGVHDVQARVLAGRPCPQDRLGQVLDGLVVDRDPRCDCLNHVTPQKIDEAIVLPAIFPQRVHCRGIVWLSESALIDWQRRCCANVVKDRMFADDVQASLYLPMPLTVRVHRGGLRRQGAQSSRRPSLPCHALGLALRLPGFAHLSRGPTRTTELLPQNTFGQPRAGIRHASTAVLVDTHAAPHGMET